MSSNAIKRWLFIVICYISPNIYANGITLNTLFTKSARLQAANAVFTFSGSTSGGSINYMEYCLSSNCGSCDMPLLFTPLSGTLSYGTYTINAAAMGNLLKQVNLGAGSYNIKMTVQSTGLDCAGGAAYCRASEDTSGQSLCISTTYNGTSVTSMTQNDSGNAILNSAAKQYLYIADASQSNTSTGVGRLLSCPVNSNGSVSSNCNLTPNAGIANLGQPYGVAITTVNNTQYAYIVARGYSASINVPSSITACPLNALGGGLSSSCAQSTSWEGNNWLNPTSISMVTIGTTQYAYVTDPSANKVVKCTLDPVNVFGSCVDALSSGSSFTGLGGITFTTVNNVQYAYIADISSLLKCSVDQNGGLSGCSSTGDISGWEPSDIKFAYSSAGVEYAYVANPSSANPNLYKCNIDSSGGLNGCQTTPASSPSWAPLQLSYSVSNGVHYFYVVDNDAPGTVWSCPVNASGALSSCSVLSQLQTDYNLDSFKATTFAYTAP